MLSEEMDVQKEFTVSIIIIIIIVNGTTGSILQLTVQHSISSLQFTTSGNAVGLMNALLL